MSNAYNDMLVDACIDQVDLLEDWEVRSRMQDTIVAMEAVDLTVTTDELRDLLIERLVVSETERLEALCP